MYEIAKAGGYLLSPLSVVLAMGIFAAVLARMGRRRAAASMTAAAFIVLWVTSTPALGWYLSHDLESRYPALTVEQTPRADAIVVLGGALSGAHPPERPTFNFSPAAGRVWHAAALWRAGKAKWVIVSGGNGGPDEVLQPEALAISEMLQALGVPKEAIRLDAVSRNTRENAREALREVRALHSHSVLLVTSAQHMERALRTFRLAWSGEGVELIPAATDYWAVIPPAHAGMWFPTVSGLSDVTTALKEFAGIAVLGII